MPLLSAGHSIRFMPLATVFVLAGCATLPADRGLSNVNELIQARDSSLTISPPTHPNNDATNQSVEALLAEPLNADNAQTVAFLLNPRVNLTYATLGLNQADWVEASRLSNPVLSLSAMRSNVDGDSSKIGFGIVQNFTDLLFIRSRKQLAGAELKRTYAEVALSLQQLALEVNTAYFEAVAFNQIAQMRTLIAKAAGASAELAKRFHAAGNISALELARESAQAEQAQLDQEAASAQAMEAKMSLSQLMGLTIDSEWQLEASLPLPVAEETPLQELIHLGHQQRLDLIAERAQIERSEQVLSLAKTLRWVPFLEIGIDAERDFDRSRSLGPNIAFELPLFGKSRSGVLRAHAFQEYAHARVQQLESEVAHDVAKAYTAMSSAHRRVERHRDGLMPQREAIVARMQELQNYMLIGQFELLLAKQEEYNAYESYLMALKDFWLARIALSKAVGGELPSDTKIGERSVSPIILPPSTPPASPHHDHHH